MQTIAVFLNKGGVGKTLVSYHLAHGMSRRGFRVLLIDMDPQGNATTQLGLEPDGSLLYECLAEEARPESMLEETGRDGLSIVRGGPRLLRLDRGTAHLPSRDTLLRYALEDLKDKPDLVIIDCPPAMDISTKMAIMAADHVLAVTELEELSMLSVPPVLQMIKMYNRARRGMPRLELLGLALNRYDRRTRVTDEIERNLDKHLADKIFSARIPIDVNFNRTLRAGGTTLFESYPSSRAVRPLERLTQEVCQRLGLNRLEEVA